MKLASLFAGMMMVILALAYSFDELSSIARRGTLDAAEVVLVASMVILGFSGATLMAQLPDSLRARFKALPSVRKGKQVYGFGTMLAVGVGATLGSPLFVLIPLNVFEYEAVSFASLALAAGLSIAMAKVYSDMYRVTSDLGLPGVGGPSFTMLAVGRRSVRYFVSRLSMWVANTALAAYSMIVFVIFDFEYMPQILTSAGFNQAESTVFADVIAIGFIGWTMFNVVLERRFLRLIGVVQVVLTSVLVAAIIVHSSQIGNASGWDLSGIFSVGDGTAWIPALVINTGFLYLLFFGFQEIQSLEQEALEKSAVPVLSTLRKGLKIPKASYLGKAMVLSVVIASAVNIFYGIAVFSTHRDPAAGGSVLEIPALFVAQAAGGTGQQALVGVAFLIATITTFVPAFLAAARHLGALGEDGYMPRSLARLSWVFTIIAVGFLAVANRDFLVNITDFMVLVSLGIIALSSIWLKGIGGPRGARAKILPAVGGGLCFLFGGAVYFIDQSVVVFGTVAVIFAYLIFDVVELGNLGAQLFLASSCLACLLSVGLGSESAVGGGGFSWLTDPLGGNASLMLVVGLFLSAALLTLNVIFDVKLLRRTWAG